MWSDEATNAFVALENALVHAPLLALPDATQPFVIETDASNVRIGAILSQVGHPVAFVRKVLSVNNQLLSVYDKELLTIVHAVSKWHQYLSIHPFMILTNQRSLKFLLEQRLSTPT